jgi:hypothetical protein
VGETEGNGEVRKNGEDILNFSPGVTILDS